MIRYFIGSYDECADLVLDMDTYYGYPNGKTITSAIPRELENGDFFIAIVPSYFNELSEESKSFCIDEAPSNIKVDIEL